MHRLPHPRRIPLNLPPVAKSWPLWCKLPRGQSQSKQYWYRHAPTSDGRFHVRQDEVVIGNDKPVKAGEMFTQPATLKEKVFCLTFTPPPAKPRWQPQFS
jgi:hypothetical protein